MHYSTIKITSKKVSRNNVNFSTIEITSKKVRENNVHFLTIEITSKNVSGNNVDFSTIEITWKKVRANKVDFSISEITSKKHVEKTCKFVEIWSSTYRGNIHVESTSIQRCVPVGYKLYGWKTREFLQLRIRKFQGIIFVRIWTYREIFKSELVHL